MVSILSYVARYRLALMLPGMLFIVLLQAGCASVGEDFPAERVNEIVIGKTSKADIREMFGSPWRTGYENGKETWSYGQYKYQLFDDADTKDLVIRFDDSGYVSSYTFNKTNK